MNINYIIRIFILMVFAVLLELSSSAQAAVREYWVAAEKVDWNYAPSGKNQLKPAEGLGKWGQKLVYSKYRYIGYTDGSWSKPVPQPEWMGILGPQLRAVVGDTIKVHFLNKTDRPLSMHPHGVFYNKDNEGADSGSPGASVPPNQAFTYTWKADKDSGPGPDDPSSIIWLYHSHVKEDEINLGLIGTLVIARKGMQRSKTDPAPKDVDQEFTSLFMIFSEADNNEGGLKHTINGRLFGNLEGYETRVGNHVRWHVLTLGSEEDNHTAHWHGQTILDHGRRTDVVALLPASMDSVDMIPRSAGDWLFHCHVSDHMVAGMATRLHVSP